MRRAVGRLLAPEDSFVAALGRQQLQRLRRQAMKVEQLRQGAEIRRGQAGGPRACSTACTARAKAGNAVKMA